MQAILIKDEYADIAMDFPYEVDRVFHDRYIKLKNSPRRYMSNAFKIMHKGKRITHRDAYKLYKIEMIKKKLGMK